MTDIYEDKVLSDIFALSLDATRANATASPPVVYLKGLAEVIACSANSLWDYVQ